MRPSFDLAIAAYFPGTGEMVILTELHGGIAQSGSYLNQGKLTEIA